MNLTRKLAVAPLTVAAVAMLGVVGTPADAAKKTPSCTRGEARVVMADGGVRIVRMTVKKQSANETRRQHLLACWTKTGRRVTIAQEVDHGLDNIARTRVEIVDGRYVGVREHNEGGVSEAISARIYDARTRKLLHTSEACDFPRGDMSGVDDVAFLEGGGMAIACDRLYLFRKAGSAMETLEPAGTRVVGVSVTRHTHGFGPRLFWVILSGEAGETQTAKSLLV